ncbi:hypothetical protein FGE12_12690 [Aggregicoccus sp. 17bor-14]|uniref:hypothetical protein n=1 Tax=Myxococcaceae TaxID=31 RepID=UPI00129CB0F1|nr:MULTISPECIES: hypothetical protein [Myxococcaceae]MBF5043249.1 hypothetical protein [Simulacricoccus sp. 17bor-14]MRI89006.1 hypothetical protein [Aggregicoccus sp. 17bor-14]
MSKSRSPVALSLLLLSLCSACQKEKAPAPEPVVLPAQPTGPQAPVEPQPTPAQPTGPQAPVDPEPTPAQPQSREDALACEALLDLRTLMDGQSSVFGEKDRYTADPAELPALPACADGTHTAAPDAAWMSGCHFRYRVTDASATPDGTFTLQAVGAGTAEGREYTVTSGHLDSQRVWPAALAPEVCGARLAPSVCEAAVNLRGLFTAEKAYFGEKDRYSEDLSQVGFLPEPCLDGTRFEGGLPPAAGCHFAYSVEVQGTAPEQTFTAVARGEGTELRFSSSATWTPAEPSCGR